MTDILCHQLPSVEEGSTSLDIRFESSSMRSVAFISPRPSHPVSALRTMLRRQPMRWLVK
jgi:hypothetical protein